MTVRELAKLLSALDPDLLVVTGCEHDSYVGHDTRSVRLVETGHAVITTSTPSYVPLYNETFEEDEA